MTRTPFKFLDAYGKADTEIFFGREEEVESLYQMSFQTNLMLVYGVSGTGKTSLVQCGLAGKFESSDLFDITIRRKKEHCAGFSLNALGFAGYLLATDRSQLDWLGLHGPVELLKQVASPA
jgi:AAA+ ATPase superfamily predicted ATPase